MTDEELVQYTVMDQELIQNGVMDEKFVKNSVMDAKIDAKVGGSVHIQNWWMDQIAAHQSKFVGRIC